MSFKWSHIPGAPAAAPDPPPGKKKREDGIIACKGLKKALDRVFKIERPEILHLGPLCGDTVVYLAERGARVHVDEYDPPPPRPPKDPSRPAPEAEPARLVQPADTYDLVLAWDSVDFTPPEALSSLGAEFARILRPGGWLFLLSQAGRPGGSRPGMSQEQYRPPGLYRILDDECLLPGKAGGRNKQRCWIHPNRDLERGIAPLRIQGTHLLRNQLREYTAMLPVKKNGASPRGAVGGRETRSRGQAVY